MSLGHTWNPYNDVRQFEKSLAKSKKRKRGTDAMGGSTFSIFDCQVEAVRLLPSVKVVGDICVRSIGVVTCGR